MGVPWPVTLQDTMNEEGFSYQDGETRIRSENDFGIPKVRRRFTKAIDTVSVTINLTQAQYSTFRNFFDVSLNGGVNVFDFVNPLTGLTEEFRFVSPPTYRSIGGGNFVVAMQWEKLP